jgi:hypothetical protein
MSRAEQKRLTPGQAERLRRAARKMDEARIEWARLVREFGVAASARTLGVSPRSVSARLRTVEADSKDEADSKNEADHDRVRDVIRDRNPSVADVTRRRSTRRTAKD